MGEPSFEADHYDADIIILSLNRLNETLEAISSALRQKGVSLRVAVLDQGSSMENQQVLRENIRECAIARLFTEAENRGVGAGRNFISSTGHGRIIVGLDNDAVFLDDYVIHMLAAVRMRR